MTTAIQRLTAGDAPSGIYRMDMSLRPDTISHRVSQGGMACCYLDGSKIVDKRTLMDEIARAMSFPDYFGHNWDALEECVTDLNWLDATGCVLLYDHAAMLVAHHPDVWNTFYDILHSAVSEWKERKRPFYVLLRNTGNISQSVPSL